MEASASGAGRYPHAAAWLGGVFLAGIAVVTAALCGTIAILVRNAPARGTQPVGSGPLSFTQGVGLVILFVAGCGYAISHAASQEPDRLPRRIVRLVHRAEQVLAHVPPVPLLRGSLVTTNEVSRLVAAVGPFASSAITAAGTWLATGLGWRALLVGGAVAGATAAGAAILIEPHDTSIQSGGMVVALVVGAFAGFGFVPAAFVIAAAGAVWIILVAEVTDAVVQRGTVWVTVLLGGIALATSSVLAELDNTLGSLTVSGTQPRSFADLAPLLDPLGAPDRVATVGATWLDFRRSLAPNPSADVIAPPTDLAIRSLYAVVDSAGFALAYALLLIAACVFLLARLDDSPQGGRLRSILTVARFTIPVLFAVDVAENLSGAAAVLPYGASRSATTHDLDGVAGLAKEMAYLHWLMSLSKWVIILGVVVALVATGMRVLVLQRRRTAAAQAAADAQGPHDDEDDARPVESPLATAWRSARAHVVLVVVLAFAVRNAQAMDAIRLLAGDEGLERTDVAVLIAAIAVVAVAIRYLAELVGREVGHLVYLDHPAPTGAAVAGPARTRDRIRDAIDDRIGVPGDPSERNTDRRVWFGSGIGALAVVMWQFLDAPGLLIPVALWAVIELLSIPLRAVGPDADAERRRRKRARLRFVLVVAFGAVVYLVALVADTVAGAAAVRLLLAALVLAIAFVALLELIPFATVRGGWFGLRPAVRSCCGLVPLCRTVIPGVARRCLVAARWFVRSVLRRLVMPLVWLLDRIGVRTLMNRTMQLVERLAALLVRRMTGRGDASPAPTASGAEPPAAPAPQPAGAADAALTAQHAASIGRVLGALTPMVIGAAVIRSALGLVIYAPGRNGGTWLLLVGVALVLAGPLVHGLPRLRDAAWGRGDGIAAVTLALAVVFAAYMIGWQVVDARDVIGPARALGSVGVLCLGIAMFALVATTIAYLGDATPSLASLQLVRIRRSPFFAFAIVWVLVAGVLDQGGYHSIDTHEAENGGANLRVTTKDAFDAWVEECASPGSGREAVPMVFVAATGGGIRAAYWTAKTLEGFDARVQEQWQDGGPCTQPIFAASGASGGSVGLGTYAVQHLLDSTGGGQVTHRLDDDYLAPTVAWMLMADLVRPFFLWDGDGKDTYDRAGMLELALQDSWPDEPAAVDGLTPTRCEGADPAAEVSIRSGLRETWCLGAPLVILNGAEVNSACRFNTSVLDNDTAVVRGGQKVPPTPASCRRTPDSPGSRDVGRGPLGATVDLHDSLCPGDDVSMSTATLLSARFPFITPSGRVERCGEDGSTASYVVDGGYLDNSGAASLVELWAAVSTMVDTHNAEEGAVCIVPVFIQIDNGYEFDSGTSPSRPNELTLPLSTVFEGRGSRESEAKQVAAAIFSPAEFSGDKTATDPIGEVRRWDRIVPEGHPGIQAPLGWALSDAARVDLDTQLDPGEYTVIDRWLDPELSCE